MVFRLTCIQVNSEKSSIHLQHFSLQVTHQDVHLTLFRCLKIDHTLIFAVNICSIWHKGNNEWSLIEMILIFMGNLNASHLISIVLNQIL